LLVNACGGGSGQSTGNDAAMPQGGSGGSATGSGGVAGMTGAAGTTAFVPAAHPTLPQVVDFDRAILRTPKVQLIIYSSDTGAVDVEAFLQELTHTSYWADTTSEYGVGPLTILPTIRITTAPPATMTDATLRATLTANTSGANPIWGTADPSTIYLFAFPSTTIESGSDGSCCTDYGGYHTDLTSGATVVPYAVGCACPGSDGSGITDLQERTVNISHELVEAATDPFPDLQPGYREEDNADIVWTLVSGGEVADMCEFNDDANYVPPGSTYMIQRSWSNAAAALVQNPCVPHTSSQPYFNSFPALDSITYLPPGGTAFTTQGVNIPIGQSKTIAINLFSTAPTGGPWTVLIYDYDQAFVGTKAYLGLTLDKNTGQNGDTLHLTIAPKTADAQLGGEAFIIFSDLGKPGDANFQSNMTMGLVTN
jgi:hypothetical protein